jgi:hypothetical protein
LWSAFATAIIITIVIIIIIIISKRKQFQYLSGPCEEKIYRKCKIVGE